MEQTGDLKDRWKDETKFKITAIQQNTLLPKYKSFYTKLPYWDTKNVPRTLVFEGSKFYEIAMEILNLLNLQ